MTLENKRIIRYLQCMQQAVNDILEHTNNLTFEEFVDNKAKRHKRRRCKLPFTSLLPNIIFKTSTTFRLKSKLPN